MKIKMLLDNAFDPDIRVYKEALYLVNNKNELEILCLDKKNKFKDNPLEEKDKIKIRRFFSRTDKITELIEKNAIIRKLKYVIYFWWLIKFMLQVKKYLKNEEYDMLHCHDLTMAFCACIFLKKQKIVFDMHEYYKSKNNKIVNWVIDKMVKYTQNKATWIIYLNEMQKQDIKENNLNKLIYLPNYPEEKTYIPVEKKKSEKLRINYIGFLRDYEALKTLINLGKTNPNLTVGMYGMGSCYKKIKEEKFSENVKIYGEFDGLKELSKKYSETDILYCVYNPQIENWRTAYPVKLYESLITETPIIVCENTVSGEFVETNKIGETVKYGDVDSLNKAIEKIANQYEIYVKNIKEIKNIYKWEYVVKNLDKIFIN